MINDNDWNKIKLELKKNIEPAFKSELGTLTISFEEIVDLLRGAITKELGNTDLDDREEIIKAIIIRYKNKDVDGYGTASLILALKLESFFKRIYSITHETLWPNQQNMLKGQIVTFVRRFKYTYSDPQFIHADDTVFDPPNKEFIKTDTTDKPLFPPDFFIGKFPLAKQFKIAYDIRNQEGHLDPESDDDRNSLLIKDLMMVYLLVVYKYADKLKQTIVHKPAFDSVSNWNIFKKLCNNFDHRQSYFLITDKTHLPQNVLAHLANLKWDFVFDLDTSSDTDGVLKAVKPKYSQIINQIIHTSVDMGLLPSFPDKTTFWYFARGNSNVLKSLPSSNSYADWRTMYVKFTSNLMLKYYQENFGSKSTIVNVVIVSTEALFIKDILYSIKDMGAKIKFNFVFANSDNRTCDDLIKEIRANSIEIPLLQMLEGFRQTENKANNNAGTIHVPCISSKGQSVEIPHSVHISLNQYFKILHLDILKEDLVNVTDKTFYQGRNIEWRELDSDFDVKRDITKSIFDSIKSWLQSRSDSGLFTLVHHPGAGGTTIARRIAFELYEQYPVLLFNETTIIFEEDKITDRLHQLFSITELPTLIIIDNSNISKAQIEQLKRTIEYRLVKAIILTVESGFNIPIRADNTFYLKSELDNLEIPRFLNKFSKEFKQRESAFRQIVSDNNSSILTPFYFGLIANEENFSTIEKYVKIRLDGITNKERDLIILLAFFNHYAKGKSREVPHFVISNFLNLDDDFILLNNHISNAKILDLIIETEPDQHIYWKTIHPIISLQILRQVFNPNSKGELNPFLLKSFSINIIRSLRTISDLKSNEILQLLYSLFIQRNDGYLVEESDEDLSKESHSGNKFSKVIEDLQTNQSRIEVFDALTREFPTEHPHFWGHFSRLYSIDKDFNNALECINKAIALDGYDYRLFHIKGMCFRTELYRLVENYYGKKKDVSDDIINQIQKYFEDAKFEFFRTFELAPYNEHGYVSYVQMVIRTIEFAFSISDLRNETRDYTKFITAVSNEWYRSILASAKEVIDIYYKNNVESISQKLDQYKIVLLKFWGEKDQMLNAWHGLLGNNMHDQNLVRRNLAYAYLAKGEFNWPAIKGKDLLKIQELASENLEGSFDERDLHLWFEVSRRLNSNVLLLINRLEELEFKIETIHSAYYLMCLYAIKAIAGGSKSALDDFEKNLNKIKTRITGPYSKIFCPEWIGLKDGNIVLVHNKDVGKWNKEKQFFENPNLALISKLKGRVVGYNRPQEGFIEIEGSGIKAIYQPGRFGHYHGDAESGTRVEFYLGFNYDGARAFLVTNC